MEYQINYEEIERVVHMMPKSFDSHEFIRKYIWECPESYGGLLIKHGNVSTVHGEIAIFLRSHLGTNGLPIKEDGEKPSEDIFKNIRSCVCWTRTDI